jgi:hypothetical protein
MDVDTIGNAFLRQALTRFEKLRDLGTGALDQLEPADLHYAAGSEDNSIAVIVKHMHGNMLSRWTDFLSSDGNKPWRDRDGEFTCSGSESHEQVRAWWDEGWALTLTTIASLTPADLERDVTIRGVPLSVMDAILRQLSHYGYHTGQIVYLARMRRGTEWRTLSIAKGKSEEYVARVGD